MGLVRLNKAGVILTMAIACRWSQNARGLTLEVAKKLLHAS